MLSTFQYDFTQPTIAQEAIIRNRGGVPTQTPSGAVAGSTTCVNGTVAIGNAGNGIYPLQGLVTRYLVINRTLNALEVTQAEAWAKQGMAYVGIIGDSTAALCNSTNIFFNVQDTASFLGNAISGAANITYPGDKIADQLAKWNALSNKQSLQAIIIQVGLNDANTYGGNGTKTSAQMIADLQGLVGAVNAQKPAACKVYICGMTPAKGWLGATTTPATAYAAWQDMNTAINGGGPTPITGVDARIMGQVAALNDGSDYLNPIYNFHADGVHPSNEGRFINAQYWRAQLVADGLIV
jgi:lysophospholipase L1-like esterase